MTGVKVGKQVYCVFRRMQWRGHSTDEFSGAFLHREAAVARAHELGCKYGWGGYGPEIIRYDIETGGPVGRAILPPWTELLSPKDTDK